ncbi:MAG: hypothetical protein LBR88_10530 [Zoogloeaceae bacterium]|jgi:hypothetical protein|nr:hypothetical protein [Zoogloeaceae bacterium]
MPLLFPWSAGNWFVLFEDGQAALAFDYLQHLVLAFTEGLGPGDVEIMAFDFSLKSRFKTLLGLKDVGIYTEITRDEAEDAHRKLYALARRRLQDVLRGNDMVRHNRESAYKEKIHLLLWNLEQIIPDFSQGHEVLEFMAVSAEAGIYILAYGRVSALSALANDERRKVSAELARALIGGRMPLADLGEEGTAAVPLSLSSLSPLRRNCLMFENHGVEITSSHDLEMARLLEYMARFDLRPDFSGISRTLAPRAAQIAAFLQRKEMEDSRQDFLKIPIGRTLDDRNDIFLSLGKHSDTYHVLVAGMSGMGKTSMLNHIIVSIAKQYTARQVLLFLMDYKEGVEFQVFESHPNCTRLFLDNTRPELARQVVDRFAQLIEERSVKFRQEKVSHIDEYNGKNLGEHMPRVILIIDEVQKLFAGSYSETLPFERQLAKVASTGRGFGIHIILSTQNLTSANIPAAVLKQIPVRIAFKLDRSESGKIFDSRAYNDAAASLKPYQFIYNNDFGEKRANQIGRAFVPYAAEEIRETLAQLYKERAEEDRTLPYVDETPDAATVPETGGGGASISTVVFSPLDPSESFFRDIKATVTAEDARNFEALRAKGAAGKSS